MPRAKKGNGSMPQSTVVYAQPNNKILYIMLGVITLFMLFMTVKVMMLEKKVSTGGAGGVQVESPLSVDDLKGYAKELKLDTGKFNKCLDSGEKKALVDKDIAHGSSLGVQGTPGFFINGQFLAGAFPFALFKEIIDRQIAGTASSDCLSYSTELQPYCSDPQNLNFNPVAQTVDVSNMVFEGSKDAKVTLVEFSDFECPFCIQAYPTVRQIQSEYKDSVKFYYKQFPLTNIHPNAEKAAEASLCALDQGKFFEYYHKLFGLESQAQ